MSAAFILVLIAANWLLRIWLGRYTSYVLANVIAAAAVVVLGDIFITGAGAAYEVPALRQLLPVQLAILVGGLIWMRLASPRPGEFSRPSTFAPSASSPVERTGPLFPVSTRQAAGTCRPCKEPASGPASATFDAPRRRQAPYLACGAVAAGTSLSATGVARYPWSPASGSSSPPSQYSRHYLYLRSASSSRYREVTVLILSSTPSSSHGRC